VCIVTRPLLFALCVVFAFAGQTAQRPAWQPSPAHTQVPIWPGKVPGAQPAAAPESTTTDGSLIAGHQWIDDKKFELNREIHVTGKTPPTFLLQAEDDPVDNLNHSLVYYIALKKAGVPVEMHLYAHGGIRPAAHEVTDYGVASISGDMAGDDRNDSAVIRFEVQIKT
jgi:acetyl esterase/lipase